MKIGTKLILGTTCAVTILTVIGFSGQYSMVRAEGIELIRATMSAVLTDAESAREATAHLHQANAFDKVALMGELQKVGRENFRQTALYRTIPVVAAWLSAEKVAKEKGYQFRVVRDNPRNPVNLPTPTESRVLRALEVAGTTEFFEVDEQAKKVFLRVDYQRKVVLKPTEKVRVFKFHFERRDTPPNAF